MDGFSAGITDGLSEQASELRSWKLKRALVPVVGARLIIAGDMLFRKSR